MFRLLHNEVLRAAADDAGAAAAAAAPVVEKDVASLLYASAEEAKGAAAEGDKKPDDAAADKPNEQKPEDGKADAKAKGDTPDLSIVPADGKYAFTLPDGFELDTQFAETAMPVLKEANITGEQANKLAALFAGARKQEAEATLAHWEKTNEEWAAASRSDKEFGGDKFDASINSANSVLKKFGTSELTEFLKSSGAGNHPEVIRFMARVGNAFSDDTPVSGTGAPAPKQSIVDRLYS